MATKTPGQIAYEAKVEEIRGAIEPHPWAELGEEVRAEWERLARESAKKPDA